MAWKLTISVAAGKCKLVEKGKESIKGILGGNEKNLGGLGDIWGMQKLPSYLTSWWFQILVIVHPYLGR